MTKTRALILVCVSAFFGSASEAKKHSRSTHTYQCNENTATCPRAHDTDDESNRESAPSSVTCITNNYYCLPQSLAQGTIVAGKPAAPHEAQNPIKETKKRELSFQPDFWSPNEILSLGLYALEGKDPDNLVIRRNELYARYEHQFFPWLYFFVTVKKELTDMTYYAQYVDPNAGNPLDLKLQAGLKSRWKTITGVGVRLVPYNGTVFKLHVSLGFEEMDTSSIAISSAYFLSSIASVNLTKLAQDHVTVEYDWQKVNTTVRLAWTLPWADRRFTPYLEPGMGLVKSELNIHYDQIVTTALNAAGATFNIVPTIPSSDTFYLFAPVVGAGLEVHVWKSFGADISCSAMPFGDRKIYAGNVALELKVF